jgi:hypothetical protein
MAIFGWTADASKGSGAPAVAHGDMMHGFAEKLKASTVDLCPAFAQSEA